MKPLNLSELQLVIKKLQAMTGGRLQELKSGSNWYELQFYHQRDMHPVIIELSPRLPMVLPLPAPANWPMKRTPVALFINAHLRDKHLQEARLAPGRGRVLELIFEKDFRLEVRLFPHGQNLIVFAGDKKISHSKVLPEPAAIEVRDSQVRTLDEICSEYLKTFLKSSSPAPKATAGDQREKVLAKKIAVLEKMRGDLEQKQKIPLKAVGEWLKVNQSLQVPSEWQEHVDLRLSFSENLQNVFAAAKDLAAKISRAEERIQILEAEISALKSGGGDVLPGVSKKAMPPSVLQKAGVKGRTIDLSSGHRLYLGKSGADNLRILREASAWDYWLHLKDEPGSHAILRRQKNEKIADNIFLESLKHLVKATYGEKAARHDGEKFAGLVVECRYVKPIKGDRLGRVNYQNERVISFVFKNA